MASGGGLPLTGTPQNLDELALQLMRCPLVHFQARAPAMIQDYIAQALGAAMLKSGDNIAEVKVLRDLFYQLTRRTTP
jgi:hypothetical protein